MVVGTGDDVTLPALVLAFAASMGDVKFDVEAAGITCC